MYVYDCNTILTIATNNISKNEMIRALTPLTEDLKSRGFHPGFHFMDNEASTTLNLTTPTMNIKHHLLSPINHRTNNEERVI